MSPLSLFILVAASGSTPIVPDSTVTVPDSLISSDVNLSEIVVQAPRIVRKPDMDVFYPSRSAVERATDGLSLLTNLMIPTLTVNDVLGSIKSSGQEVEIRINGRKATTEQLRSIQPETVKRVEWLDNPGLRYGNAYAVVNFIIANPTVGGSVMLAAMPALTCAWGEYNASVKLNQGRSQWSVDANYKITNHIDIYRDYHETFTYPDGSSLTRVESPLSGSGSDTKLWPSVNYSYINPEKTVVWVSASAYRNFNSGTDYSSRTHLSDGTPDLFLHDKSSSNGISPSLNAYIEHHLPNRQTIVADFNASVYNGRSTHIYTERLTDIADLLSNVDTRVRDRNHTISFETDYIRRWKSSRFTAGLSYTANRNRSTYINLDDAVYHQQQDRLYFFGEYFRRIKAVSLTAGLGAQYTDLTLVESGRGNSSWSLRPRFSLVWRASSSSQFRLNFSSWQTSPSLGETNEAPQQIDGFQWQYGNPDLHTYSTYRLRLTYNFDFPRISGTLGTSFRRSPHAIAPILFWDDDRLITTFENSHGYSEWQAYFSPQLTLIPSWLIAEGTIRYTYSRSAGTDYRHTHAAWNGDINLMLTHWGFTLTGMYSVNDISLYGEKISRGETFSLIMLSYRWQNFNFNAGMMMPFGRYSQGSESLNRYNYNHYTMRTRSIECTPLLKVSYNFNWGHQKRGVDKLINSDSSVQQSTPAAR